MKFFIKITANFIDSEIYLISIWNRVLDSLTKLQRCSLAQHVHLHFLSVLFQV